MRHYLFLTASEFDKVAMISEPISFICVPTQAPSSVGIQHYQHQDVPGVPMVE